MCFFLCLCFPSLTHDRLQEKAADTIESLHKAGMKVWVLTGDKMETAAATCYASKLFHRNTQILELTTKRTEEQSLHDVLFDLSRTVLRQHGGMTRDTFSGCVCVFVRDSHRLLACQPWRGLLRFYVTPGLSNICTYWTIRKLLYRLVLKGFLFVQFIRWLHWFWSNHWWSYPLCCAEALSRGFKLRELQRDLPGNLPQLQRCALLSNGATPEGSGTTDDSQHLWSLLTYRTGVRERNRRQSEWVIVFFFVFLDRETDQSLQGAPDHASYWRWS